MGRLIVLCVLLLAVALGAAPAAHAHSVDLQQLTCTRGAQSIEEALAYTPGQLQCDGDRFGKRDQFVRTSAHLRDHILPTTSGLVWQTEASDFSSMVLRFTYADGTQRLIDVDRQMAARNWFAGNRFDVPVPEEASPLTVVDTVIERPFSKATVGQARIMTERESNSAHYTRSLGYILTIGLLIIPLIYNLLFFRILGQGFVLWHLAMVAAMLTYTIFHSGLIFIPFPDFPVDLRWRLASISFVASIVSAIMVISGLIERQTLSRRIAGLLILAAAIPIVLKLVALVAGETLRLQINNVYLLGYLPAAIIVLAVLFAALARRSRGAIWGVIALFPLIVVGVLRILQGLDLIELPFAIEDAVFVCLVLLTVITAMGVGDRFLLLKQDRDQARSQAIRLGQMANTDGLTGLANRRAFDLLVRLKARQGLIVADVDRFKAINDDHGHQVGDAVLCHVAGLLRSTLRNRPDARIFRLGGEEFAVVVDASQGHELMDVAEIIRTNVEEATGSANEAELPKVTISLGAVLGHGQLMHSAFADADAALYRAKGEGRNRTILYGAKDSEPVFDTEDRDRPGAV